MKTVIFLCSWNHARSRLAELLFNDLAHLSKLQWQAISRGFMQASPVDGPIHPAVIELLEARRIPVLKPGRRPMLALANEVMFADLVVCLGSREEHEQDLARLIHPHYRTSKTAEFWGFANDPGVLPAVAVSVEQLVERLKGDTA